MVFVYTSSENTEFFTPENEKENIDILENALPCDIWVNFENSKSLPVYIRYSEMTDSPTPTPKDISVCGSLLQIQNTKKQYKNLTWANLSQPLASQTKTVARWTKVMPAQMDEVLSTKQKRRVDFELAKQQYDESKLKQNAEKFRQSKKTQMEVNRYYKTLAEQNRRGYSDLFDEESIAATKNQKRDDNWEEDFM